MSDIKPAHSLYGESVYREYTLQHRIGDVKPSPPGGVEYRGRGRCTANNDTCEGIPAKGTAFCIGHLRSMAKANGEPDPVKKESVDGQR
jgi:hypothetical protein